MKSRRQFIWQGSLAATALLVAKPFEGIAKCSNFFQTNIGFGNKLTLLHTANINNITNALTKNKFVGLGGFANTSKAISQIKSSAANTLLLDSGNVYSKNSKSDEHQQLLGMMKQSGYDALAMGKHELMDERMETLQQFGLPILHNTKKPYTIIKKGNIRVGIITANAKNNVFDGDIFGSINDLAKGLSDTHGCNLVVCLSSLGYKNNSNIDDVNLAASSEYIDIILGNEAELFMKKPHVAQNKNKHEVVINHVGNAGVVLGNLEISFDENGKKKSISFDNLLVGAPNYRWGNIKG